MYVWQLHKQGAKTSGYELHWDPEKQQYRAGHQVFRDTYAYADSPENALAEARETIETVLIEEAVACLAEVLRDTPSRSALIQERVTALLPADLDDSPPAAVEKPASIWDNAMPVDAEPEPEQASEEAQLLIARHEQAPALTITEVQRQALSTLVDLVNGAPQSASDTNLAAAIVNDMLKAAIVVYRSEATAAE
jgi:hypothetical protein